jgi:hypothetical protein
MGKNRDRKKTGVNEINQWLIETFFILSEGSILTEAQIPPCIRHLLALLPTAQSQLRQSSFNYV